MKEMRKLTWFLLIMTFIVATLRDCVPSPVPSPQPSTATPVPPTPVPSPTPSEPDDFKVVTQPSFQDTSKTDVYLQNHHTGEEIFFITLEDVHMAHYHNNEYHNGHLY